MGSEQVWLRKQIKLAEKDMWTIIKRRRRAGLGKVYYDMLYCLSYLSGLVCLLGTQITNDTGFSYRSAFSSFSETSVRRVGVEILEIRLRRRTVTQLAIWRQYKGYCHNVYAYLKGHNYLLHSLNFHLSIKCLPDPVWVQNTSRNKETEKENLLLPALVAPVVVRRLSYRVCDDRMHDQCYLNYSGALC